MSAHNRFADFWTVDPTRVDRQELRYAATPAPMGVLPPNRPLPGATKAPELCMLAEKWRSDCYAPGEMVAQIKANGVRALWLAGDLRILISREGVRLDVGAPCVWGLDQVSQTMAYDYGFREGVVIDGELAHPDGLEATLASLGRGKPDPELIFWAFDAVPFQTWKFGHDVMPQEMRTAKLQSAMHRTMGCRPGVGFLRPVPIGSHTDLCELSRKALEANHEGLVVKARRTPYTRRRSIAWMKVKEVLS